MAEYIESILIIILEVFCCRIFFGIFGTARKEMKIAAERSLLLLLMLEFFGCALFLGNWILLKAFCVVLGISIVMYYIIEISFLKSLILSFLYEGMMFAVDYLTYLLCISLFPGITEANSNYFLQGGLFVLLDKILLFCIIIFIRWAVFAGETGRMRDSQWLKFIFFPIYTICTIAGMVYVLENPQVQNKDRIFFVIAFGLVGMNILVFYLLDDIMKRESERYEERIFRLQVKNQMKMYYSMSEDLKRQRKKAHEYKNQLVCIQSMLDRDQIREAGQYIEQLGNGIKAGSDNICTHHVVVDAILNAKYEEMTEKDIVFVFRLDNLSGLQISDEDLVVLLSNLLNNAIEACEKCGEKKIIRLKFVMEPNAVVLAVKNTYENALIRQDGMLHTTKGEEEEHGIGISNIVHVVEKYGGSYVIKPEDGEFLFSIFIPRPL